MNPDEMHAQVDRVVASMTVQALEERIAPVKCDKNPEAPECQVHSKYGVQPMYGVEIEE